ncbi:MAG: glucose-1-phosphate adenylyltransferase [Nitrosomonas sp.]|nr:glucose-1-phosphate adenylyltransferase [Nitrosomonas sp.]
MKERRHSDNIVAFVMAGGEGKRLRPLTTNRCKPAVPFGGRYRIVDFVLSNLINSGILSIYLLVQYKPQTLIEHVRKSWTISPLLPNQFVTVVPPQMQDNNTCFRGTADAVYQSIDLLRIHRPDMVAVFGADHIYRMDVGQMVRFHREHEADISIAAQPVPIAQTENFGILEVDNDGRIRGFEEKPSQGKAIPSNPDYALASMGNYLFNTNVLLEVLEKAHEDGDTDFGHHVLPKLLDTHHLYAYDFTDNEIPGIKPYEEVGYWRDVGSLDAYFEAHKDVLGMQPRFDAFNPQWPIFSSHYQGPVAKIFNSTIDNGLIGAGAVVNGSSIRNSIIRRESVIEPDVELDECIIMDYVRICRGSRLRRVIVDRHNNIEAGSKIGFDPEMDRAHYEITPGGVVVVPIGKPDYYARDSRGSGMGYDE